MTNPTLHPGVYVREIPSGVRAVTGVATSITVFLGRTLRGPENDPKEVTGFTGFERLFGGLWSGSPLSFAVRDFFANGGGRAIIVRLTNQPGPATPATSAKPATPATLAIGGLVLRASGAGTWGGKISATVTVPTTDTPGIDGVATSLGVPVGALFDLAVTYAPPGGAVVQENFRHLTVVAGPRRVDDVLAAESDLVRVNKFTEERPPAGALKELSGGTDGDAPQPGDYTRGLAALDVVDLFNLMCIPPPTFESGDTDAELRSEALNYCRTRRAMLLVDPPSAMTPEKPAVSDKLTGERARNAALYFPRLRQPDPTDRNRIREFVPCGAVAGVIARTDASRGVWKAPAGIDATLAGVADLEHVVTDDKQDTLNPLGINCLRTFPVFGRVVWGARTMRGADILADEYKYVPVRRLALYIEESLFRGTQWVVFEPNDEPLWSQIRLNLGAFMQTLFRQGAFAGTNPRDAYFVKCDAETTNANDQNLGRVNILVGFAPLRPAEFVILQLQQIVRAQA